ncbi:MAG TPA: AAA family ATPase [Acidobacteriota bacterium]|nr:AAA family ATPase [Acidobacteriota bacterium]
MDNKNIDDLKKFLDQSGLRLGFGPQQQTQQEEDGEDESRQRRDQALQFDFRPSQIKEYLDRYVIQQDDAKKVLATAVCDHYHNVQTNMRTNEDNRDYKKQNILLIGPTGVGKTYLVQNIARLIGVPFVKADATKFSETGYVGGDVEDLVRELVHQAQGDIQLAEYGIVYLDEIDKIAGARNLSGRDVSGHGVQRGMLKLMEETEVPLRSPTDIAGQMQALMEFQTKGKMEKKTISTKNILFIVSGAFDGLLEIIKKRIGSKRIGFQEGERIDEHQIYGMARSVDFIEFGFEAEFIGRLPVYVHCNQLDAEDLFKILKYSEGSLLKQYKRDFLAYGIDVFFTDEGMKAMAQAAVKEQTGARGLMTVGEKTFREYKYMLPDNPQVKEFVVEADLVEDPQAKLEKLLADPEMYRDRINGFQTVKFAEFFKQKFGIEVTVTREAVEHLKMKASKEEADAEDYLTRLFGEYEHGLNLLRNAEAADAFEITPEVIDQPSQSLDGWIRRSYKRD